MASEAERVNAIRDALAAMSGPVIRTGPSGRGRAWEDVFGKTEASPPDLSLGTKVTLSDGRRAVVLSVPGATAPGMLEILPGAGKAGQRIMVHSDGHPPAIDAAGWHVDGFPPRSASERDKMAGELRAAETARRAEDRADTARRDAPVAPPPPTWHLWGSARMSWDPTWHPSMPGPPLETSDANEDADDGHTGSDDTPPKTPTGETYVP